jgi:2-methylfumaryl-CoA isomerase
MTLEPTATALVPPTPAVPLEGLRVIELASFVAAPTGGLALGQMGAEVVRVDPLGGRADHRRLPLSPAGASVYWASLNKGKSSVALDLGSPVGQELVRRLIAAEAGSGILLTNQADAPWLNYETLRELRPDLIMVRIKGLSDGSPAVDYTVNSRVGVPFMTGPRELDAPVNNALPAWDLLAGCHAANAVLAAELRRRQDGRGSLVEIALEDVALNAIDQLGYLAEAAVCERERGATGNYVFGTFGRDFATADGKRVMVVALTSGQWARLLDATGVRPAIEALEGALGVDFSLDQVRFERRETIASLIAPWFAARDYATVAAALDRTRVLWGPYRTFREVIESSPDLRFVEQPLVGRVPATLGPLRFADLPAVEPRPSRRLGEDTAAVLGRDLGLGDRELAELRARGVIA